MSPLVNPMSTSLTSREGDARAPAASNMSYVAGTEPNFSRWESESRVPNWGRAMVALVVEVGVTLGGVRHVPGLLRSMMSLIVRGGSVRFEYAWASAASGRRL